LKASGLPPSGAQTDQIGGGFQEVTGTYFLARVHAATKAARQAFYEIYAAFVSAFREASERLRRGDRNAPFPVGSFPPALPFVAG
jgi:hypothetical protein